MMKTHLTVKGQRTAACGTLLKGRQFRPWLKAKDVPATADPARVTCKACQNSKTFKLYSRGWDAAREVTK